jgi:hypothetical protein
MQLIAWEDYIKLQVMINGNMSDSDDDDQDGHQHVGTLRTPNAADSPRRLHQITGDDKQEHVKYFCHCL